MNLENDIREHNRLCGIAFSTIEFALVALGALFFVFAGIVNDRIWLAIAFTGIGFNSLTVCVIALVQRRAGQASGNVLNFILPSRRAHSGSLPPNLTSLSLWITCATMVPFALIVLVAGGRVLRGRSHAAENSF